jgi:hypothetical protein
MRRSTDRFLVTHQGSLARPPELMQLLTAKHAGELSGEPYDGAAFELPTYQ